MFQCGINYSHVILNPNPVINNKVVEHMLQLPGLNHDMIVNVSSPLNGNLAPAGPNSSLLCFQAVQQKHFDHVSAIYQLLADKMETPSKPLVPAPKPDNKGDILFDKLVQKNQNKCNILLFCSQTSSIHLREIRKTVYSFRSLRFRHYHRNTNSPMLIYSKRYSSPVLHKLRIPIHLFERDI